MFSIVVSQHFWLIVLCAVYCGARWAVSRADRCDAVYIARVDLCFSSCPSLHHIVLCRRSQRRILNTFDFAVVVPPSPSGIFVPKQTLCQWWMRYNVYFLDLCISQKTRPSLLASAVARHPSHRIAHIKTMKMILLGTTARGEECAKTKIRCGKLWMLGSVFAVLLLLWFCAKWFTAYLYNFGMSIQVFQFRWNVFFYLASAELFVANDLDISVSGS